MITKVVKIEKSDDGIIFENGIMLLSDHDQDCCESHQLSVNDLTLEDFEGLEFDLSNDDFFRRIPDYGIELVPINGHSVKIPGHGYNNGYYSSNLLLLLVNPDSTEYKRYDISECQDIKD